MSLWSLRAQWASDRLRTQRYHSLGVTPPRRAPTRTSAAAEAWARSFAALHATAPHSESTPTFGHSLRGSAANLAQQPVAGPPVSLQAHAPAWAANAGAGLPVVWTQAWVPAWSLSVVPLVVTPPPATPWTAPPPWSPPLAGPWSTTAMPPLRAMFQYVL